MNILKLSILLAALTTFTGCAVVATPPAKVDSPLPRQEQQAAQQAIQVPTKKVLKRKIAIGRFSNETRYGRSLQTDENNNPLGKQAADVLSARLIASNQFIVLERGDLNIVENEQAITGAANLIGADTLIVGSVTEFGRTTTGTSGFLSSTKVQTAKAKVELRLVDVNTGQAFFSASGDGQASTESGEVMGFGSRASYDGTLNDRAIAAAISDVLGKLMTKLEERPWRAPILKVDGQQVYIAAGARQGLAVGDTLKVYKPGERIKNPATGFMIDLPAQPIGTLQVISLFGDSETNEGAVAKITEGSAIAAKALTFVQEQ